MQLHAGLAYSKAVAFQATEQPSPVDSAPIFVLNCSMSNKYKKTDRQNVELYLSKYAQIVESYTACQLISYRASPHNIIPRLLKQSPKFYDHGTHFVVQSENNAPIVIPYVVSNPKKMTMVFRDCIEQYGGVFDVSRPYANALEKMGYRKMARPWGDMDFIFSTNHLVELKGGRYKKLRYDIRRYFKKGTPYIVRMVERSEMSDIMGDVKGLIDLWSDNKANQGTKVGNQGYCEIFLEMADMFPESMQFRCLAVYKRSLDSKTMVGLHVATKFSNKFWIRGFSYSDWGSPSATGLALNTLAKEFSALGVPYSCDGDGGSKTCGVYHNKQKFISKEVMKMQNFSHILKKKV